MAKVISTKQKNVRYSLDSTKIYPWSHFPDSIFVDLVFEGSVFTDTVLPDSVVPNPFSSEITLF